MSTNTIGPSRIGIESMVYKIKILSKALHGILEYSSSNVNEEIGSILIGILSNNEMIVKDYIKAEHTNSSLSSLTFTHDTWDKIHLNMKSRSQEEKIVGWHHTHPGHGVFLSKYDMFIQENYFNLNWQIALVVDPLSNKYSFFQWDNGMIKEVRDVNIVN